MSGAAEVEAGGQTQNSPVVEAAAYSSSISSSSSCDGRFGGKVRRHRAPSVVGGEECEEGREVSLERSTHIGSPVIIVHAAVFAPPSLHR